MIYTGIGSRETPANVLTNMYNIAKEMSNAGYVLRSGHADGADTAFEQGCISVKGKMEIFLPWNGFNYTTISEQYIVPSFTKELEQLAASFHPAWNRCSQGAKKLHMRNVCQILGKDLKTPTNLVICYTHNGTGQGGTGQAIRIAKHYKIPVYDLGNTTFDISMIS